MHAVTKPSSQMRETPDYSALRLMLSYVEAECLRIGAGDAARHASLAAAMMPAAEAPLVAPPQRPFGRHLH